MTKEALQKGLRRIDAAGIRSVQERHVDVLYRDLINIDDNTFSRLLEEFLGIETAYPKSLTGWFLRRAREINTEIRKAKEPDFVSPRPLDNPPPIEAQAIYFKLIGESLRIWEGTSQEYRSWWGWFNDKWLGTFGDSLVELCRDQLETLKKTVAVRKNESAFSWRPE